MRGAGPVALPPTQPRHRHTDAYVGLALLATLLIEAASGWLLWVAAHRRAALASVFLDTLPTDFASRPWLRWLFDVASIMDLHVWFGYLLLGLTGIKLSAVWHLIRFLPTAWRIARHDVGRRWATKAPPSCTR